ncbi:Histone-lysine N-methyltransferase 2D [Micromonospora saelicesensis]|uniref:Histone-lysine N-methyltransferase 2D n=1 Tax=Micromonospora saelicesensis TaxID=285676 RepID=A0ABX9CNF7_9ACTN|nr:D-alanyl-D-alanine carboxypeptidase/D-alanyl-D-alanine-endopeptidase [Micromonospora saelicesensis]RAO03014.1 Histone-lysine N-methyltransferase 2D [Micromonospora saelicesensis]RAO46943.1 Histone-lysine N-methyltransferase 2D [Micromonospora saelicesensis]
MGREDSHYRPDGGSAHGTGRSGSGSAKGRVPVPEAHLPRAPEAATPAPETVPERPPPLPWRPPAGPASPAPNAGHFPAAGGEQPVSGPPRGSATVPVSPAPVSPSFGPGPTAPGGVPPLGPPISALPAPADAAPAPVPAAPSRRRRLPVVLAAVLLLVLASVGVVITRPGPVAGWLGDDAGSGPNAVGATPEPAPSDVLGGPDSNAPVPTPDGVRAALDPLVGVATLGDRVNVSVADVITGQTLFAKGADDGTVPASVTKLATAVTVLAARGPGYRIPTRAVAGAKAGEVVIVGGGDPTLGINKKGYYPGAARLDDLAAQVRTALGGTPPTSVTVDGSVYSGPVYGPGWDDDIPTGGSGGAVTALMTDGARTDPGVEHGSAQRFAEPDLAAGKAFARLLGVPTDAVKRGAAPPQAAAGASPAPGTELGVVQSPPLIRLVDVMISESDNLVAEALARQVALARGQPASFDGGAAAMDAEVAELGLPADEISVSDGSGLSRLNRISPSLLTDLIRLAASPDHPELAGVFGGLPVGGWSGTLNERYRNTAGTAAGAGSVRAKTGTLTGVHSIAGLVTTADGRLLTFAVLTDKVPGDRDTAQPALDRIAAALAGCGCG